MNKQPLEHYKGGGKSPRKIGQGDKDRNKIPESRSVTGGLGADRTLGYGRMSKAILGYDKESRLKCLSRCSRH